jgi:hypothetical protein
LKDNNSFLFKTTSSEIRLHYFLSGKPPVC